MNASDTISVYLNRVAEISSLDGVAACECVRSLPVSVARCCSLYKHRKEAKFIGND